MVSYHDIDSVRDLDLLCNNKLFRPVGIMVVDDTHNVLLMSVVPVS